MFGGPTLDSTLSDHLHQSDSIPLECQGSSLAVDSHLVQGTELNTLFGIDQYDYSVLLGLMFSDTDPGHSQFSESTPVEPLTATAVASQSSDDPSPCSAPEHRDNMPPAASDYFLSFGGEIAVCIWEEPSGGVCGHLAKREPMCKHVKRVHLKIK
jgi:hypothetical protein